eukprot:gene24657-31026_t
MALSASAYVQVHASVVAVTAPLTVEPSLRCLDECESDVAVMKIVLDFWKDPDSLDISAAHLQAKYYPKTISGTNSLSDRALAECIRVHLLTSGNVNEPYRKRSACILKAMVKVVTTYTVPAAVAPVSEDSSVERVVDPANLSTAQLFTPQTLLEVTGVAVFEVTDGVDVDALLVKLWSLSADVFALQESEPEKGNQDIELHAAFDLIRQTTDIVAMTADGSAEQLVSMASFVSRLDELGYSSVAYRRKALIKRIAMHMWTRFLYPGAQKALSSFESQGTVTTLQLITPGICAVTRALDLIGLEDPVTAGTMSLLTANLMWISGDQRGSIATLRQAIACIEEHRAARVDFMTHAPDDVRDVYALQRQSFTARADAQDWFHSVKRLGAHAFAGYGIFGLSSSADRSDQAVAEIHTELVTLYFRFELQHAVQASAHRDEIRHASALNDKVKEKTLAASAVMPAPNLKKTSKGTTNKGSSSENEKSDSGAAHWIMRRPWQIAKLESLHRTALVAKVASLLASLVKVAALNRNLTPVISVLNAFYPESLEKKQTSPTSLPPADLLFLYTALSAVVKQHIAVSHLTAMLQQSAALHVELTTEEHAKYTASVTTEPNEFVSVVAEKAVASPEKIQLETWILNEKPETMSDYLRVLLQMGKELIASPPATEKPSSQLHKLLSKTPIFSEYVSPTLRSVHDDCCIKVLQSVALLATKPLSPRTVAAAAKKPAKVDPKAPVVEVLPPEDPTAVPSRFLNATQEESEQQMVAMAELLYLTAITCYADSSHVDSFPKSTAGPDMRIDLEVHKPEIVSGETPHVIEKPAHESSGIFSEAMTRFDCIRYLGASMKLYIKGGAHSSAVLVASRLWTLIGSEWKDPLEFHQEFASIQPTVHRILTSLVSLLEGLSFFEVSVDVGGNEAEEGGAETALDVTHGTAVMNALDATSVGGSDRLNNQDIASVGGKSGLTRREVRENMVIVRELASFLVKAQWLLWLKARLTRIKILTGCQRFAEAASMIVKTAAETAALNAFETSPNALDFFGQAPFLNNLPPDAASNANAIEWIRTFPTEFETFASTFTLRLPEKVLTPEERAAADEAAAKAAAEAAELAKKNKGKPAKPGDKVVETAPFTSSVPMFNALQIADVTATCGQWLLAL